MESNFLMMKRDNTTNTTTTEFCATAGGIWPAVQSLIAFFVTNIFAHAATTVLANGADTLLTMLSLAQALFLPVNAGDRAFYILSRWGARLRNGEIGLRNVVYGDRFEDAATSGALAISIPLCFAPLVHGRWESVTEHQEILMLNNAEFRQDEANVIQRRHSLPFKVSAQFHRYLPYVLPPTTRFPGYRNYKISPTSNPFPQVIAVIQVFLSSRQLYLQYQLSIQTNGLSSPYLVVIPYILMSLVNLIANTLVASYTHVTLLPMAQDRLPEINEVYIESWPRLRVIGFRQKETSSIPASNGSEMRSGPNLDTEETSSTLKLPDSSINARNIADNASQSQSSTLVIEGFPPYNTVI
jgi:hypothetical protein